MTSLTGLIFVADRNSNAVHVISMEGNFIYCINGSHGIERPLSINIDSSENLQIGCDEFGIKDKVAKLHVVEIID